MTKAMQLAKEALDQKKALMLNPSQSILGPRQLLYILQKTPKKHTYSRPGKGGETWDYVTSSYVKQVLNYVFGWMWDFEIKEHGQEKDLMWVLGRLTIKDKKGNPMITKEQFGRSEIKYYKDRSRGTLDFGNDLKSAASDALKKCASELGIASDIYGKQEFKDIQNKVDKGFKNPEDQTTTQPGKAGEIMASPEDGEKIRKQAEKMNLKTTKQIENKIKWTPNWKRLTKNDASKILAGLLAADLK